VSSLEEALPPPSRPSSRPTAHAAGRWPDVLDVHLTAQWLTVSADTVDALLQRRDLPGRTVDRTWLITTTAVLQWLEQSPTPRPTTAQETVLAHAIAHGDTAALMEAVRTGQVRRGTTVQPAARSGRVPGSDAVEARHLSTTCAVSCTAPTDVGIFKATQVRACGEWPSNIPLRKTLIFFLKVFYHKGER
jgi:hypothetical protein